MMQRPQYFLSSPTTIYGCDMQQQDTKKAIAPASGVTGWFQALVPKSLCTLPDHQTTLSLALFVLYYGI
jgi:sugar phosphate permease